MKRIIKPFIIVLIVLSLMPALPSLSSFCAAEEVVFTKQPVGGSALNNHPFTVTYEVSSDLPCYLEMREGEFYDWGVMDEVTSPFTLNMANCSFQYRLRIDPEYGSVYSDVFTVTFAPSDKITTAEGEYKIIGDFPLGYGVESAFSVSLTNTGENDLVINRAYVPDDSPVVLIENRAPLPIKPGQTDSETWSVRPKDGLGIGYYEGSVFFESDNLELGTASSTVRFWVVESDVPITYELSVSDIDLGVYRSGDPLPPSVDLVLRATGTGNLTKVRLLTDGANKDFFQLKTNNSTLDQLNAGMDSGTNWYINIEPGALPGDYETTIYAYADELAEKVPIKISLRIIGSSDPLPDEPGKADGEGKTDPDGSGEEKSGSKILPIIIISAAVALLAAACVVIVTVLRRKKRV